MKHVALFIKNATRILDKLLPAAPSRFTMGMNYLTGERGAKRVQSLDYILYNKNVELHLSLASSSRPHGISCY
jgi:hypothetical protein